MAEVALEGPTLALVGEPSGMPENTLEDLVALLAEVAALLNSPGIMKTVQRMVANAIAKFQA